MKLLTKIGLQTDSDKSYYHLFTEFYENYFKEFINRPINILEIGIGKGNSLKMLREYFLNASLFGIDINETSLNFLNKQDIQTYLCHQTDFIKLQHILEGKKFDIIIDDGSHICSHQQLTLAFLFRYLKSDGLYICEDLHTSYDKKYVDTDISTLEMLKNFQDTHTLKSDVLSIKEIKYLQSHIKNVDIFVRDKNALRCYSCKNDNINDLPNCLNCETCLSPNNKSITSVLIKKNVIIDAFIFYNELDMLLYRLDTLLEVTDYVVLVESTRTFVGNEKELYYKQNRDCKFKKFKDKIIHVIVDDFIVEPNIAKNEVWDNESKQRRSIDKGIFQLELDDKDIIIISDCDEIPNPNILRNLQLNNIASLEMDFYYYDIECKNTLKFLSSKICTYDTYIKLECDAQKIRLLPTEIKIENAGWHLSYFGGLKFITNKIKNFSHQEYNTKEILNSIISNVSRNCDLFGRNDIKFEYVSIKENQNLPPNITKFFKGKSSFWF